MGEDGLSEEDAEMNQSGPEPIVDKSVGLEDQEERKSQVSAD